MGVRSLAAVAGVVALLLAAPASAQSAVPEATGLKLGEGRLHPFLDASGSYDSLVGYYGRDAAGNDIPSGDLIFGVRPGLRFELGTPSTAINFDGYGEYLFYTGISNPSTRALSRLQARGSLDAAFNKDGAVEVQVGDSVTRSDRTQNVAVGVGVISLYNEARLAVPIHPGGHALEVTPRVNWSVELFDPLATGVISGCSDPADITCNPTQVGRMNYSNLNFGLGSKWKFLPKTAVLLDAQFDLRSYLVDTTSNLPGQVLRVQGGLLGLITPRLSVTLLGGYGGDFGGSGASTFIGQAQVAYLPTALTKVALGYLRTVQPVPVFGTYGDDRGTLDAKVGLMGGRLSLSGLVAFDYFTYYGPSPRTDMALSGDLAATFDVASWFAVGLDYTLSYRTSTATTAAVNYVRHDVGLRLTLRY